ncbi:MAG: hypothetical protein OHK0015_38370 [Chloroflexi bacterium OHK40]
MRRAPRAACAAGVILWIVCGALLAACAPTPPDAEGPVRATRAFVIALETRDASAMIALLEPTDWRGEIGPELRSSLALIEALDLRNEAYAVQEQRGNTAVVRLTATMAYTLAEGRGSGERPIDLRIETVRVDGQWYLRGLELPRPEG